MRGEAVFLGAMQERGHGVARLADQLREAIQALEAIGARPVLIGGLAVSVHRVVRGTRDVDFLVRGDCADEIDKALHALGYTCIHRSTDAANYVRGHEGIDLIYAHRPVALRLWAMAKVHETSIGPLHVVSAEGLIGLKLQAWVNDPTRLEDLSDIRRVMEANAATLDWHEVEEYFQLFDRLDLLDELRPHRHPSP